MERIKYSVILIFFIFSKAAYSQTVPKGFSEQLNYTTLGGGPASDFKPALIIKAVIQIKPGAAGQQVYWSVKALHHDYKKINFIKHINLTCGTTVSKKVTLYDVKNGQLVTGASFSGDYDLSDNIFKEDCDRPNRILDVTVSDFGCELADYDPLILQENAKKENIAARKKYADQLSGFRLKYSALVSNVDKLEGVDKTKFNTLKTRFHDLSLSAGNSINSTSFTKSSGEQKENSLNEIDKLLVDMDTEAANLSIDAQAFKDKNKKSNENEAGETATTSTYVESAEARKIRLRAEAQNQKNESEDDLAEKGAATVQNAGLNLASIIESDYDDEDYPVVVRAVFATTYKFIPVIKNYAGPGFNPKSESSTTDPTCFNLGFDAKFFHDRVIGFNINSYFNYGVLALSSSTGSMTGYGVDANLKFGKALQLVLKGGYESRDGNDNYDAAELGIDGTTYAKYKYYTMRYGAGLRYKFIEFSAFKENITSQQGQGDNIPAYSYQLSMEYGWFGFKAGFSPDYPALGTIEYPDSYDYKKQQLIEFGLYWRISLSH